MTTVQTDLSLMLDLDDAFAADDPPGLVQTVTHIWQQPWAPVPELEGVGQKVLSQVGSTTTGLVRVEHGNEKPLHVHQSAHHHLLIVSGASTMLGQRVSAGSYLYVPPGIWHGVSDVAPEGCVYFYVHRTAELIPRPRSGR